MMRWLLAGSCCAREAPPAIAARLTHQGIGAPFTDRGRFQHLAYRASLDRWAQRFTPKATFSTSVVQHDFGQQLLEPAVLGFDVSQPLGIASFYTAELGHATYRARPCCSPTTAQVRYTQSASACLMNPMSCSSVYLLLLITHPLGCAVSLLP